MNPHVPDLESAIKAHREGRFAEAYSGYVRLLTSQPHNAVARHHLGVLELHRGQESFGAPLADVKIQEGDRLLLRCNRENLLRLQQEHTIILAPVGDEPPAVPAGIVAWTASTPQASIWSES